MKSKYMIWALLGLLALAAAVSCGSAPPPEAAPTPPTPSSQDPDTLPPDQAALNALNEAAARAEAARKMVVDFDGPSLFPQDWQAADSLYSQAGQQKNTNTVRNARESTARYISSAEALEALRDKTLVQYHDNMEKELISARQEAVNAGAMKLVPDYLLEVDNITADAEAKYQQKDYYAAVEAAVEALDRYNAGKTWLEAYNAQMEIADRGFEIYDPRNFEIAEHTLYSAADDYLGGLLDEAQDKAVEALVRFNMALRTGWEFFAGDKRADAADERQLALDLKANVAVTQEFNAAHAEFTRADTAFQAGRFEEAAALYIDCYSQFEVIAELAREKQMAAEQALIRANQKMAESDETARAAEVILEGGF
jgi:hypothetical protein